MYRQHKIGQKAEEIACRHLEQHNLVLLTKNFQCRLGEIDLIMRDKDTIVFVEVRRRQKQQFGSGTESIHIHKQRRLIITAQQWLAQHAANACVCRFDVVSIDRDWAITWIRHAFEIDYAINS